MMYFLGQASTYSFKEAWRHLTIKGNEDDIEDLRMYLAAHYGATKDHVIPYSTGRSALAAAIEATVPHGSEIIITSLTCCAVVQAVKAAKCTPIFADVDKTVLHFGKKELEKALELHPNAQAVIVQNNLGIPADIKSIEKIAKKHKLVLIEDLAHCAGIRYADGREAGTVGRASILSFGKGKSIDTISGGVLILNNQLDTPPKMPHIISAQKNQKRDRKYPIYGWLIRGLYRVKLGKLLTAFLVKTRKIQKSADAELNLEMSITDWQARLALEQLKAIPKKGRGPIRDFYLVKNREQVLSELEKDGYIFNDIWYDIPVSPERYYNKIGFPEDECPVATEISKQIVNVPTHYSKKAMRPAIAIIKEYEIDEK